MQEFFSAAISKARAKRDRAIAKARHDYQDTIRRIHQRAYGKLIRQRKRGAQRLGLLIDSVVPRHREFTIADIIAALTEIDPRRYWHANSVGNHLTMLRKRGVIRRTRRHRPTEPSRYVHVDAPVPLRILEDMTLREVALAVRGNRTMTLTELTVAIREAGYDTKMNGKRLRDALAVIFRRVS
jgi:hypothetical protein